MNRRQQGFTLLEVLVALTIMSLIMVALQNVLQTTLRTKDMLTSEVAAAASGPAILDTIERDLRRAWVMNLQDDVVFQGIDRTLMGEPADTLLFLSTSGSSVTRRVDDRETASELVETGYRLRVNPDLPDVLELWRRQDFHLDEKPLEDGTYERLHDRVISFDVKYYEDFVLEHDPRDEWEAEELHELPAVLRITLSLEVGPRLLAEDRADGLGGDQVRTYERVIVLGHGPDLAMRVHPYPPDFSGALDGTGSAGAGGQDGDDDDLTDELGDPDGGGTPDGNNTGNPDLSELLQQLAGGGG